jgi:hypothetical protein
MAEGNMMITYTCNGELTISNLLITGISHKAQDKCIMNDK